MPEGDSNAYPMRFGTRRVEALKTVRQLVQGVPSEGSAAVTTGQRDVDSGVARGRTGAHTGSVRNSGNASALSVAADADRHLHPKPPTGGFRLVHITDPANPTEVGRYVDPNGNNFLGVALAEDQN